MARTHYRLCVDIDHQGHPVGWSYEVRDETGTVEIRVGAIEYFGPFDGPQDVFREVLRLVVADYGLQGALFPS